MRAASLTPVRGYLYALLAAVLFGTNGSVVKLLIEAGLDPAQLTLFRSAGTAIIAGIVLAFVNRSAFRITWRQFGILALLGIIGVALLQYTYAIAIALIPVGIALLFEYLAVLMVALFAFLVFKEKVKARLWVAIGCVLLGLAVVAQIWSSDLNAFGTVMALAAAVCLAVYFLVGEREVGKTSPMAVGFWTMSSATVFWLLFSGWWTLDPTLFAADVPAGGVLGEWPLPLWVPLLWNVIMGSFAPFLLSLLALKHLTATAAGITASSEVVFAFAVAWAWLGESLTLTQVIGAGVVIVGIVLAQTARVNKVIDPDLALVTPDGPPL